MSAKKLVIPQPPVVPLLGNLPQMNFSSPVQGFMSLAEQYGPLFKMRLMNRDLLVASSQAYASELCDETRFAKVISAPLEATREFVVDGLFTAHNHEPNWAVAHRLLMPVFAYLPMQDYFPEMSGVLRNLLTRWNSLGPDDEINVTVDMSKFTFDTISTCAFGFDNNSFAHAEQHPFVEAMDRILHGIQQDLRRPEVQKRIMRQINPQITRDRSYANSFVDDIIAERRRTKVAKKDLLHVMMTGVDKQTGQSLPDANIRYQILTFLSAGHETTSGLLSFALYYLLRHPDIMAKLRAEVDPILSKRTGGMPELADMKHFVYTGQVLNETLRIWPTAPGFTVSAVKDTLLGGKYAVTTEDKILLLLPALHRDPAVWGPGAGSFDPDRFSPEAEAKRPPHSFKPFGNGMRACIGRQFALQEAVLALAVIAHHYDLEDRHNYKLKVKEQLTLKPEGFFLKITARSKAPAWPQGSKESPAKTAPAPSDLAAIWSGDQTAVHGTPLLVLFGSNTRTCEEFASRIALQAENDGYQARLLALDDLIAQAPQEQVLPTTGGVVIVSPSYNGKPADNAAQFCAWLQRQVDAGKQIPTNFAVFGCGHRDWVSTYQQVPRFIDASLAALGGTRLAPCGEGDGRADLTGDFSAWQKSFWVETRRHFQLGAPASDAVSEAPAYHIDFIEAPPANAFVKECKAFAAALTVNRELQDAGSGRSTRHIEFALQGGIDYQVGDHLGVIGRNDPQLTARVLTRFACKAETQVVLRKTGLSTNPLPIDQPISLGALFGDFVELQEVASRDHLLTLAKYTDCPPEKLKLLQYAGAEGHPTELYQTEIRGKRRSILDVLEEVPAAKLPLAVYLGMLGALKPRYYSISSSPKQDRGKASITVGVVKGLTASGAFKGLCSNYLAERPVGSQVHIFVRKASPQFHLPADATKPIIMVGPGTGFGPFRGFLQERAALAKQGVKVGPALLFYGCRSPDEDFIYKDELDGFSREQLVAVQTAFSLFDSRVEQDKVAAAKQKGSTYEPVKGHFVQDRIAAAAEQIWQLLLDGAYVFVCGDAARMEPAVRTAFLQIVAAKLGAGANVAETYLAALATSGRYAKDVWAPSGL